MPTFYMYDYVRTSTAVHLGTDGTTVDGAILVVLRTGDSLLLGLLVLAGGLFIISPLPLGLASPLPVNLPFMGSDLCIGLSVEGASSAP